MSRDRLGRRRRFDTFHLFVGMWIVLLVVLGFVGCRQGQIQNELDQVRNVQLPTMVER